MDWDAEIQRAEKFQQFAITQGKAVYRRYKDDRRDRSSLIGNNLKRINLFYSNVQTIKQGLFNSLPTPDVSRLQRGDFDDDASRVAATILQRALNVEVQTCVAFKEALESAILDRLVPGIGQVWIRFDMDEVSNGDDPSAETQVVPGSERLYVDTVYWEDFLYEPARCWSKVTWVARKLAMTKEEIVESWGEDACTKLEAYKNKDSDITPKQITDGKYLVYEIWDKATKTVIHTAKGLKEPLDEKPDPYNLKDFFPCPEPLIANVTSTAYIQSADFYIAQDQYNQLDQLYARISLIIEAIKVAGLYDGQQTQTIGRMLEGQENILIPVDNWVMYAEAGGAKGLIDWYPVEQVATVLQLLQAQFEAIKASLYEVTGMSDITRGVSNQYETAKAQEIKAGFASVRMNGYSRDVALFASQILMIMGEIITQLYGDERLKVVVGTLPEPDMALVPQALEILRNDFVSGCRIQVKADTLIQADWALEKGQRTELMQVISQFLQQAVGAIEQVPEIAPLLIGMLKFTIVGYKGSAEIEGQLDTILDGLVKKALEPPAPPEPTPEEKKMQAEMQMEQQKMQMEQQAKQADFQMKQQQAYMDAQTKETQAQSDLQMAQEYHAMEMKKMEMELMYKEKEFELKEREMNLKLQMAEQQMLAKVKESAMQLEMKQVEGAQNLSMNAQQNEQQVEQSRENHEQQLEQSEESNDI